MTDYLLFHLYGPLAAWGNTAVGEYRPSLGHPSRSAILGLIAAALGIRRDQEEQLLTLDRSCRIAIRLDAPGELLRDYHTTQVPPQQRKTHYYTRREELAADKLHTILSQRDYRTDSAATVALSLNDGAFDLGEIRQALQRPALPLYLGRKSCPLALPLAPEIITAATLADAFAARPGPLEQISGLIQELPAWGDGIPSPDMVRYYWEEGETGMRTTLSYPRRDRLRSRRRWQFDERIEHTGQPVDKEIT